MKKNTSINGLCFDDILLIPHDSSPIISRSHIDLATKIGNPNNPDAILSITSPIISAPMESISSHEMLFALNKSGSIGMTCRSENLDIKLKKACDINKNAIGVTITTADIYDCKTIDMIVSKGIKIILLDVANGHLKLAADCVSDLRLMVPSSTHIMCGNVASYGAYKMLMDAGADSVRVGIGGGAACTTRLVTGFGAPTLASIMNIYEHVKNDYVNGIVADGGIKNSGDIVKALGAGASAVMLGSMLAGHNECESIDGKYYLSGLASREYILKERGIEDVKNPIISFEGVTGEVNPKGPALEGIYNILNNIRSAFTYSGAPNIKEFQNNLEYIEVSPSSARESGSRV
jgi:IMP dehydrogenase/GMP reductase